jgi:deazaflavin-dependent oxidoreductase (nitroreductase family)
MRKSAILACAVAIEVIGAVIWWRRDRRVGSGLVNWVIDPWLVRRGIVERSRGEIALIEHVGRSSGIVRTTPIHPVPTENGFRVIVPLGQDSQWARNVLAAGSCRLQVGGVVHLLDEPALVSPLAILEISPARRRLMNVLGFRYLTLRRFAVRSGRLEQPDVATAERASAGASQAAVVATASESGRDLPTTVDEAPALLVG